jgi:hypothetical protein
LQDGFIVESRSPESFVIVLRDLRRIPGEFDYVIQHHPFWLSDGSGRIVLLQRFNQAFVQSYSTQKLCV